MRRKKMSIMGSCSTNLPNADSIRTACQSWEKGEEVNSKNISAYIGFSSTRRLGILLLPLNGMHNPTQVTSRPPPPQQFIKFPRQFAGNVFIRGGGGGKERHCKLKLSCKNSSR